MFLKRSAYLAKLSYVCNWLVCFSRQSLLIFSDAALLFVARTTGTTANDRLRCSSRAGSDAPFCTSAAAAKPAPQKNGATICWHQHRLFKCQTVNCDKKTKSTPSPLCFLQSSSFLYMDALDLITSWCNNYRTTNTRVTDLSLTVEIILHQIKERNG